MVDLTTNTNLVLGQPNRPNNLEQLSNTSRLQLPRAADFSSSAASTTG